MKTNRFLILCSILSFVIVCAWAVDSQTDAKQAAPQVFNPDKPSDYPDLTNLDIDIKEFGDIGQIFMLEGIENST
ncbi:hypothetical protein GF373_06835, partial [bacterium]|nr:hypothetical protein [bacterium]